MSMLGRLQRALDLPEHHRVTCRRIHCHNHGDVRRTAAMWCTAGMYHVLNRTARLTTICAGRSLACTICGVNVDHQGSCLGIEGVLGTTEDRGVLAEALPCRQHCRGLSFPMLCNIVSVYSVACLLVV
jgi:hypothetical protein